jgi:hypothetical protein
MSKLVCTSGYLSLGKRSRLSESSFVGTTRMKLGGGQPHLSSCPISYLDFSTMRRRQVGALEELEELPSRQEHSEIVELLKELGVQLRS